MQGKNTKLTGETPATRTALKLTELERKELEKFCRTGHGAGIHSLLLEKKYSNREELDFFRLYFGQVDFIEEHKDQFFLVRDHLLALRLEDSKMEILCDGLSRFFQGHIGIQDCIRNLIEAREPKDGDRFETNNYYQESLEAVEETLRYCDFSASLWLETWNTFLRVETARNPNLGEFDTVSLHSEKYNFDRAKSLVDSIQGIRERIDLFLTLKTEFDQFLVDAKKRFSRWNYDLADNGFGEKCQLEISKCERLMELESEHARTRVQTAINDGNDSKEIGIREHSTGKSSEDGTCPACGNGEKYPDRNREVVTLILNDLFESLGVTPKPGGLATIDFATAIGFITGYSANTTKRIINNPDSKEETARNAYDKDNEVRRRFFMKLGFRELAKKVQ